MKIPILTKLVASIFFPEKSEFFPRHKYKKNQSKFELAHTFLHLKLLIHSLHTISFISEMIVSKFYPLENINPEITQIFSHIYVSN